MEPAKINVKFHKNCENTGEILKISWVKISFGETETWETANLQFHEKKLPVGCRYLNAYFVY